MKEKIKVGVIGAGVWGEFVLWSYSSNPYVELVGIADLNADRAGEMAKKYGAPKTWTDYRQMIDEEKLDIVSIVTPDYLHKQIVLDCTAKKINILLEKPVATTMDDCNAIINAVRNSGVTFMTNYFQRWIPQVSEAKAAIVRGDLGEIVTGHAKIDDAIVVATDMVKWAQSSSPIFFIMVHNIDMVRWLINSEAIEVYAKKQRKHLVGLGVETDDAVQAMVTFENGATVTFESNWILPANFTGLNDHDVRLVGTQGTAYIDLTNQGLKIFSKPQGIFDFPNKGTLYGNDIHGQLAGCILLSVAHFVDCVRNGTKPVVTLKDSEMSTAIACAIAESLSQNGVVKLKGSEG